MLLKQGVLHQTQVSQGPATRPTSRSPTARGKRPNMTAQVARAWIAEKGGLCAVAEALGRS